MASDNLLSEQLWPFRTVFSDPWISDLFTREADALTEALQMSFAADSSYAGFFPIETVEPIFGNLLVRTPSAFGGSESEADTVSKRFIDRTAFSDGSISNLFTREALQQSFAADCSYAGFSPVEPVFGKFPVQTPSGSCGSDSEPAHVANRCRGVPPSGRISKRKPRASKRGTTTYIAADPDNFRRMVQEVTGGKLCSLSPVAPVLETGTQSAATVLLDNSSFFLDGFARSAAASGGGATASLALDNSCSFPTLESWDVVR